MQSLPLSYQCIISSVFSDRQHSSLWNMTWIGSEVSDVSKLSRDCMGWLNLYWNLTKMELIVRLFPYGKTIAGLRQVCDQGHLFKDSTAARAGRKITSPQPGSSPSSLAMIVPGADCRGYMGAGGDPYSLLQTQATQTVLQNQEGSAMPRMAVLLGLMGIGMSGYSSRQLALHYKPSSHLFRWDGWRTANISICKGDSQQI